MADKDPYAGTGFEKGDGRISTGVQITSGDRDYDQSPDKQRAAIVNSFLQFGYYPTETEVGALLPSAAHAGESGSSAVAQYVNQQKAELERQKNDPLPALQQKMQESADLMKKQVTGLYGQLQDVLGSAPQLFGNMTPEQIGQYLAPLQTSFKEQLATVQGVMGSRGLAASSTENNAIAQTGQRFQENVLAAGLDVGMKSQAAKAQSIQDQIKNLLGLTGAEEGIAAGAAGQRSGQDLGQSNLIASLPFFLDQAAFERDMANKQAKASSGTNWGAVGSLAGTAIGAGLGSFAGPGGTMLGASLGGSLGGAVGSAAGGGGGAGASSYASSGSNALLLASLLKGNTAAPSAAAPSSAALFQNPYAVAGSAA